MGITRKIFPIKNLLFPLAVAAAIWLSSLAASPAATITVNSSVDAGGVCPGPSCTLRQAIATAGSGDTLNFDPSLTTIDLTTDELVINKNLTISGPGAASLKIRRNALPNDGTPYFRIIHIAPGSFNVAISGLTIADGARDGIGLTGAGAGVFIESGNTVAITDSTFFHNIASQDGGGVYNRGALTVTRSTFSSNQTGIEGSGAGIFNSGTLSVTNSTISNNGPYGGGIYNHDPGTLTISNSTLSGNTARKYGGGGIGNQAGGTVTISNCTISDNSAAGGGGIGNGGTVIVKSSIIAKNRSDFHPTYGDARDVLGPLTSQGYNLIGVLEVWGTITPAQSTDQIGTLAAPLDPALGSLQDNGGRTFTMALLSASTARDKGNSSGASTDQRGFPRPVDNPFIPNAAGGDGSDIGAFELPMGLAATTLNISTRAGVQTGDNVMIGGFIITGNAPKQVVLRALGPSLVNAGLPADTVLNDPVLELRGAGGALITSNDNWKESPQRAQIEGTVFQPTDDREAVILATLPPASYTAVVRGSGSSTGVGTVEVYDLNQGSDSALTNISSRALVETGNNVVIGGFTLGAPNGTAQIIIRGLGPSLGAFGIPNPLANPTLELRSSNGTLLASNDDWKDTPGQAAQIIAAGLQPQNDLEAAIAAALLPGAYTAILGGQFGGTGVGTVEVYNLQ